MEQRRLRGAVRLLVLGCFAALAIAANSKWIYDVTIGTHDGNTLDANVFIPDKTSADQKFPLLVFPNSWMMPDLEYVLVAKKLASEGYVTLEYTARGWYKSTGIVDIGGQNDQKDGSAIIDYALKQADWSVDPKKIGFVGVSLGAGISLMVGATDERVTTVASLAGWCNMSRAFYHNGSPNSMSIASLIQKAHDHHGNVGDLLPSIQDDLNNFRNLNSIVTFSNERSPEKYLDSYNKRQLPIMMTNDMTDRYFNPEDNINFWTKLSGPKLMRVNQGPHAIVELEFLTSTSFFNLWGIVTDWLDQFLQGKDTGVLKQAPLQIQHGMTIFSSDYAQLSGWPDDKKIKMTDYGFAPRGSEQFGSLKPGGATGATDASSDSISFSTDPGLKIGTYGTADMEAAMRVAPRFNLASAPKDTAIVFKTDSLPETDVCGTPVLNLTFVATSGAGGAAARDWQVYAFMYEVEIFSISRVMSDGAFTHSTTGVSSVRAPRAQLTTTIEGDKETVSITNWELRTTCSTVSSGHRIAIGFALYNEYFTPAASSTTSPLHVAFDLGKSSLSIPVVQGSL